MAYVIVIYAIVKKYFKNNYMRKPSKQKYFYSIFIVIKIHQKNKTNKKSLSDS
jgi:hypothetical protein